MIGIFYFLSTDEMMIEMIIYNISLKMHLENKNEYNDYLYSNERV